MECRDVGNARHPSGGGRYGTKQGRRPFLFLEEIMLTSLTPIVGYRQMQYRTERQQESATTMRAVRAAMWAVFSGFIGAFMLCFALLSLLGGI